MNKMTFDFLARPARHSFGDRFPRGAVTIVVLIAAAALIAVVLGFRRPDAPQVLTARVEQGDIQDVVEETGTVNAVRTVQVGAQVSGTIAKLYADFNSRVHRGDLIASIDPALYQGALDQAVANLHANRAQLEKDQANLTDAGLNYRRDTTLAGQGAIAPMTVDNAKSLYDQAKAQVALDDAAIRQVEAGIAVAKANLDYTTIRSPVDGIVIARSVDVGQTVAASFQAPTIFTIAQDPSRMQVYANTDESDVGRIQPGRHVTFRVDAFPGRVFDGTVRQIRMNATTVQNVVTYNSVIDFANPDLKLLPGMTAYVTIPVASVSQVMKVPNTALRFSPSAGGVQSGRAGTATVWKLDGNHGLKPVTISTGITDHAFTQAVPLDGGALRPGDLVATAMMPR